MILKKKGFQAELGKVQERLTKLETDPHADIENKSEDLYLDLHLIFFATVSTQHAVIRRKGGRQNMFPSGKNTSKFRASMKGER